VLHDDITTIDHALTRPWTVTRSYQRVHDPVWTEQICSEDNHHVLIGKENYYVSEDGYLLPVRKDQPPPDLKYFNLPPRWRGRLRRNSRPGRKLRSRLRRSSDRYADFILPGLRPDCRISLFRNIL
jgi:hypothetical protein